MAKCNKNSKAKGWGRTIKIIQNLHIHVKASSIWAFLQRLSWKEHGIISTHFYLFWSQFWVLISSEVSLRPESCSKILPNCLFSFFLMFSAPPSFSRACHDDCEVCALNRKHLHEHDSLMCTIYNCIHKYIYIYIITQYVQDKIHDFYTVSIQT